MTETATFTKDTATVRNGVDTNTMFATLDAIKAQPEIAQFRFRARNRWLGGAHNRSTIKDFYAACAEDTSRTEAFTLDAGEPAILLGADTGPNPAEYLLHALAACVTTSLVYSAAARGVRLTSVESMLEGDLDVQAAMGTNTEDYRNGFERIRMTVRSPVTPRPRSCARSCSAAPTARSSSTPSPTASRSRSTSSPCEAPTPHSPVAGSVAGRPPVYQQGADDERSER